MKVYKKNIFAVFLCRMFDGIDLVVKYFVQFAGY